jgi:ABC-type multidrug transport system ATPase subunit
MSYTLTIPKFEPIFNFEIRIPLDCSCAFHFLLGPNGCGKTLLARQILGLNGNNSSLYEDDQTKITIDTPQLRRYLPQNPQDALFPQFSLNDNIFLLNKVFQVHKPLENKMFLDLLHVKYPNQKVSTLSVGQKKKLLMQFIISSLPTDTSTLNYPIVVVLDEPFAGIDKNFSPTIQEMLNNIATSFINSHVYFLIIEHETLIKMPEQSNNNAVKLRMGIDLKIVYANKIELK